MDFYYLSSQHSTLCSLSSLKDQTPAGTSHHMVQSAHSLLATSPTMHLAHSPSQSIDRTCLQSPLVALLPCTQDTSQSFSSSAARHKILLFIIKVIQVSLNLVYIFFTVGSICVFIVPIFGSLVFHCGIQ